MFKKQSVSATPAESNEKWKSKVETTNSTAKEGSAMKKIVDMMGNEAGRLKRPHGMTLVEIMIVVTIMASVAGVVGFFVFGALDRANVSTAQMEANQLEQMVETYYMTENTLPDNLEQLTDGPAPITEEVPEDPWGNDYIYNVHDRTDFEVFSAGPDEVEGTDQDVYSD